MPLDHPSERVAAAIEAKLVATVAGSADGDYNYSAEAVARVVSFKVGDLDKAYGVDGALYLVKADDEVVEEETSGGVGRRSEFYVLGARQLKTDEAASPFKRTGPGAPTIQNRIIKDVEKAIQSDPQLIQALHDVDVSVVNISVDDHDRDVEIDGWVVVMAHVLVEYTTNIFRP